MNASGGLSFAAGRTRESSAALYDWAESVDYASPFVTDPQAQGHGQPSCSTTYSMAPMSERTSSGSIPA
jgi:hypothetical protein